MIFVVSQMLMLNDICMVQTARESVRVQQVQTTCESVRVQQEQTTCEYARVQQVQTACVYARVQQAQITLWVRNYTLGCFLLLNLISKNIKR